MSISKRRGCVVVVIAVGALGLAVFDWPFYYYSDPIRARVIDEATRQPVAGAVVVAVWMVESPLGSGRPFHAAEAITDATGQFTIPAMPKKRKPFWEHMGFRDPWIYVYRPGYRIEELSNRDAYFTPSTSVGTTLKTETLADGRVIAPVGRYNAAARRFCYWNGRIIPIYPYRDDVKGQADSLAYAMDAADSDGLAPAAFPRLWRAMVNAYDDLPSDAVRHMPNPRELISSGRVQR